MHDGGYEAHPSGDYSNAPMGFLDHLQPGASWSPCTQQSLTPLWRVLGFFGIYRSCQ